MEKRGHYDEINNEYYINISANSNTLKSVLIIEAGYQVDFNQQNALSKVLGFTGTKYEEGFHESENVVNILTINSILVKYRYDLWILCLWCHKKYYLFILLQKFPPDIKLLNHQLI